MIISEVYRNNILFFSKVFDMPGLTASGANRIVSHYMREEKLIYGKAEYYVRSRGKVLSRTCPYWTALLMQSEIK